MTDTIQGSVKGVWLEPNRGVNQNTAKYTGVNTQEFRWGVAHSYLPQENGLIFSATPSLSTNFNEAFTLGELSFFNSAMADVSTVVESVPLSIELGLDSLGQTKKFNFNLELETTLDIGNNPDDWADFVYFPSVLPKETFTTGGKKYTLEILGFSKDGGKTLENRFNVRELEGDTANLVGKITVAPKILDGDKNSTSNGAEEIKKITGAGAFENDEIGFTEGGVRDLSDMYEFTVDNYSQVNVTLDQLAQNANVEILDGDAETILFQSTESGRTREKITEFLDKGNYFVRVYPEQDAKTKYRLGVQAKAIVGEKDSLAEARDLGNLSPETFSLADSIGAGKGKLRDTQDYYKFSVTETSEVLVTLDELKANANITLLDSQGTLVKTSENTGKKGEKIFEELSKGDYYLKVEPKGGANTGYVLGVKADVPESDADQLPGTNLGTVNTDFPIGSPGEVGFVVGKKRDEVDYYSFQVEQEGEVKVRLDGFTGNVNIRVLNAQGEAVGESDNDKKSKIVTLEDAEPGTYSIEVKAGSNNRTSYGVSVSALPPFVDDYPTDATAYDFGTVAQGKKGVVNNKVGFSEVGRAGRDETDFFKFTIDKESLVDVSLGKLKSNADIILWQKEGNGLTLLNDSKETGRKGEKILDVLDPGTYYVQVEPFGNERTNYQLSVNVQDKGVKVQEEQVGDLTALGFYEKAEKIGLGTGVRRNEIDQYEFSLSSSSDLQINLDGLKQDADIELFKKIDGGKQLIKSSTTRGRGEETITEEGADKGDYILEVKPFGAAKTNYQLTMSAFDGGPDTDGGDNGRVPSTLVNDLGTLSAAQSFDNMIGFGEGTNRDQNDFYKFTVSQDTPVNITLTPDIGNANLEIRDQLGSLVYSGTNSGTAKNINEDFEPGTYYVRVFPSVTDRTTYNLSINPGGGGSDPRDPDGGPLPDDTDYVNDIRTDFASGSYSATDTIGFDQGSYRDVNDYRLFSVSEKSNFSLNLTNLSQNADVFLYNKNYTQLASSTQSGSTDESIEKVIEAGDYYVRVVPKGLAQTNYDLNMSADAITGNTDNVAPGNSLGILVSDPLTASDLLGFNDGGKIDTVDYYNFTSDSMGFVNVDLTGLVGNADIELYAGQQLLGSSNNSGTNNENINAFVEPGNYLVKVFGQGSQTPYDLSVSLA